GRIAGGDQVAAGDERSRAKIGRRLGFVCGFGDVIQREVAVRGGDVEAVQREVLLEVRQAEEAFERGGAHLADIAEAHVVLDQRDDLGGVFVGEAEARENLLGDSHADFDVAVEADAIAGDCGIGRLERCGLADVVQQRAPGERWRNAGGKLFEQQHGVRPDVAFGVVLRRLGDASHAHGFGQDAGEQAKLVEQFEAAARAAFGEDTGKFVANAFSGDLGDLGGLAANAFDLEVEVEARGEADGAHQAELVLGVAKGGVADGADDTFLEIAAAADKVEHGGVQVAGGFELYRIEQHAVDGEVAAEDVFARVGGELHSIRTAAVGVGAVGAEGGDFGGDVSARQLRVPRLRRYRAFARDDRFVLVLFVFSVFAG